MKQLVDPTIEQYAFEQTQAEPRLLQELAERTQRDVEDPQMLTGRIEGRFLKLLVQMLQPKLAVEIGTFTGYSALSIAEGLPPDGRLITCDINPIVQRIAQAAFDSSPVGKKIELRMGRALETLLNIDQPIDFAFIDADKENYPAYYETVLAKMPAGGVMLLDNMFYSGEALNPQDASSQAIAAVNRTIATDSRVENVLLTIRDGVQLVRKK